jgi:hypothetical protein
LWGRVTKYDSYLVVASWGLLGCRASGKWVVVTRVSRCHRAAASPRPAKRSVTASVGAPSQEADVTVVQPAYRLLGGTMSGDAGFRHMNTRSQLEEPLDLQDCKRLCTEYAGRCTQRGQPSQRLSNQLTSCLTTYFEYILMRRTSISASTSFNLPASSSMIHN